MPPTEHQSSRTPISRRPNSHRVRTRAQTRALNAIIRQGSPLFTDSKSRIVRGYGKRRSHRRDSFVSISSNHDSSQFIPLDPIPTRIVSVTAPGDLDTFLQPTSSNAMMPLDSVSHQFVDALKGFCEGLKSGAPLDTFGVGANSAGRKQTSAEVKHGNEWRKALDGLISTCYAVTAKSKPLAALEDRLAIVAEELVQKETSLRKVNLFSKVL